MSIKALSLATSLVALSNHAWADPPSHVKVTKCSPLIRQELVVIVGHPLVITFPQGESTWLAPMSGKPDIAKDDIVPRMQGVKPEEIQKLPIHNLITLWPDAPGVTTMTVIAQTADGQLKPYPFTLLAISDDSMALDNPAVTLNLICKNTDVPTATTSPIPPTVATKAPAPRRPAQSAAEKAEAEERLRTDSFNAAGEQACHYHAKGKHPSTVEPRCPMDNGVWTLIRFPGLTRKPAVYIGPCEKGNDEERLARQHQSGDLVVVEEIAERFCLRLGSNPNDVLEIVNDNYDPEGKPTNTDTISSTVSRDVLRLTPGK